MAWRTHRGVGVGVLHGGHCCFSSPCCPAVEEQPRQSAGSVALKPHEQTILRVLLMELMEYAHVSGCAPARGFQTRVLSLERERARW